MNSKDERELAAKVLVECVATICDGQSMEVVGAVYALLMAGWVRQACPEHRAGLLALFLALLERFEQDMKHDA